MKTKITLLLATLLTATTYTFAGPSDSVSFALVHGNQQARQNSGKLSSDTGSDVKWVLAPNGKGGFTQKAERDTATTSIALSKSSKAKGCDSAACCAKH